MQAEIAKEKSIVLDEIAAVEDTPDDDVDERLWGVMYPNQAIGKPVLGNEQAINTFDKQMIERFMERMYGPEQIVISVSGNFDDRLIQLIKVQFGSFKRQAKVEQPVAIQAPKFHAGMTVKAKDIEQAHICIGFPGLTVKDERIHDLVILDSILGGTMSSRLFQEVREERGLAYSICSYYSAYKYDRYICDIRGTAPDNLRRINRHDRRSDPIDFTDGITENELRNAKEQLKGGFLLGLESSESRMHRNGKNELILQEHKTIDEVVALIDGVQVANVYRMANEILTGSEQRQSSHLRTS